MLRIKGGRRLEGSQIEDGRIWGTYLHGIFDNSRFRRNFLNKVRNKIGLRSLPAKEDRFNLENEFDKLAALIRKNIDMKLLYKILDCPL
jgi:adenosylcobyric acid synthase